ncbi:NO signaling/Golgi transport ligand-binding domain-containing protein [Ampelomyces quisqualis]|uniref:NO signaling/Golgi transport ligand-binding domain-containing protein n=1 Tax=Ampelomyces quisqualis TaxID=50730 RepID=A0A6A5R2I2_AMPQU|nr:NO signaling/Golgi transport ligand-binding domain-containing protein [Ampelomyces quisqualis]
MTFGLEALFEERLEVFPTEPSSVLHATNSHVEAVIKSLVKERDDLQVQAREQASTIEQLERRIYTKVAADAQLPVDVVRRLQRLENDCQHLRSQNAKLNENLKAAESETATLRNTIAEKAQKMKGANKKTKNAKEVAVRVEEKAKDAVNDKQRHLASERKMKKERNDALMELSAERKIAEGLRTELKIEQSGKPHLRETEGSKSNFTTVVVPIEFRIRRQDYYRTIRRLRVNHNFLIDRMQEWHGKWLEKLNEENEEEEEEEEDGGYPEDSGEDGSLYGDDGMLYGGMLEGGNIMTGAEHDSWRSMRGLEQISPTHVPTVNSTIASRKRSNSNHVQHCPSAPSHSPRPATTFRKLLADFLYRHNQAASTNTTAIHRCTQGSGLRYPSNKKSIYDRNLNRSKNAELSRAAFAYLFIEMIAYAQKGAKDVGDLEQRLNQQGYPIGVRLLDLLLSRSANPLASIRPTRVITLVQFIAQQVFRHLFGRAADALERSGSDPSQYMIFDNEPLVNQYISLPKELSSLNCAAFVAGVIEGVCDGAGFPTEGVTAHSVGEQEEGKEGKAMWPGKTVFLIKFKPEVLEREEILGRGGG